MNAAVVKIKLSMILASIGIVLLGLALGLAVTTYLFGYTFGTGLIIGILGFIFVLNILQWLLGPYFINMAYRAKEVKPDDPTYGWLLWDVSEVARNNGLPAPKVYIANVPFPNAFAYGSPLAGKRVAITAPTLRILNRDELKAVLGHELGHLRHRDVELLMAVGLIPALVYWLGYSLFWGGMFGEGGRGNNSGLLFLIGIALIAVSFLFQLFMLFLNRMREAYADINAAQTVPGGASNLQTALAKIVASVDPSVAQRYKSNTTMKMLFFAPIDVKEVPEDDVRAIVEGWKHEKVSWHADLFSDHPHPAKRIQLLEKMKGSYYY
ncbi:zinc metalloprotease HtpX [Sulfodiicoccus acidiphilus]|uniref:zinc metalloprotease HtpX n=1 Tax=Sulfodiicoccus acidiphilus TaxID=1670455 RepID=UPI000F82C71C|nr:zinc metalloprotease HtpX [Sulfodiicoccus acidiphilus]